MATYKSGKCPICGSSGFRTLGSVNEPAPPVSIPDGSAIVKCKNCKLIFVDPMPFWDQRDYANLYDETYFAHYETEKQKEWLAIRENVIPKRRYDRISSYLRNPNRKMLEIGAGKYAFMCKHLRKMGWDVTAQEPAQLYADELKSAHGLSVVTDDILQMDCRGEFSLIFADSVMEHIPDPVLYSSKLADMLTPGGVLYSVSPNESSVYNFLLNIPAKLKGRTPHYISPYAQPYHLMGFSRKSLEIIGDKSGLGLIRCYKADDYMSYRARMSDKNFFIKQTLALIYSLAQTVGLGTNCEVMFTKKG